MTDSLKSSSTSDRMTDSLKSSSTSDRMTDPYDTDLKIAKFFMKQHMLLWPLNGVFQSFHKTHRVLKYQIIKEVSKLLHKNLGEDHVFLRQDVPMLHSIFHNPHFGSIQRISLGAQGDVFSTTLLTGETYASRKSSYHLSLHREAETGVSIVMKVSPVSPEVIAEDEALEKSSMSREALVKKVKEEEKAQAKVIGDLSSEVNVDIVGNFICTLLMKHNLLPHTSPFFFFSTLSTQLPKTKSNVSLLHRLFTVSWMERLSHSAICLYKSDYFIDPSNALGIHAQRFLSFFFQVFFTLLTLNTYFDMVHNDMFLHNLMYEDGDEEEVWFIKTRDNIVYRLPLGRRRFFVIDWGRASLRVGGTSIQSTQTKKVMGEAFDLTRFSNDFHSLIFSMVSEGVIPEVDIFQDPKGLSKEDGLMLSILKAALHVPVKGRMVYLMDRYRGCVDSGESWERCFYDKVLGKEGISSKTSRDPDGRHVIHDLLFSVVTIVGQKVKKIPKGKTSFPLYST